MDENSTHAEDWQLPLDQLGEHSLLRAASEHPANISKSYERIASNPDDLLSSRLKLSLADERSDVGSAEWSSGTSGLKAGEGPRVFLDSNRDLPHWAQMTECLRRTTVEEESNDSYHDSDLDIFDLFNACNGVLRDGLLDIRKLDELSQEELEVMDIVRLREIWSHSASGCRECEEIIMTLNSIRAASAER